MEFYPPLNIDQIFDKTINDLAISKFGFKAYKNYAKSKSQNNIDLKNYELGISKSKSFCEKSPIRILRKLGLNERIFHGLSDSTRSYIYRTVIIASSFDLFKNLGVIYKSINEWKSIHPLLRCRIFSSNNYDKYFSFNTNEKINNKENLKFYYYSPNHSKTCDDIWKLLVEREITIPLDVENGLLWRLTFFHIKTVQNLNINSFFYSVILTYDHSIMDGRSSYTSLLQLFSLIEHNYLKIKNLAKQKQLLPSKEEIFKPKLNFSKHESKVYVKAPSFLNMDPFTSYIRLKNLGPEEEENGMIFDHEGNPVISIKQLINISKNNNSKFRTLVIQKTDFDIIVTKCKEYKVKVTTFLNMCIVQALRLIYEKFDDDFIYLTNEPIIHFTTNVSLREFSEYLSYEPDKNSSIGCYIGLAFSTFDKCLNYGTNNWVKNFWSTCHEESNIFHQRLNSKEFIHSIHLPNKNKEADEFFYHFGNSNLGILESSISEKKLIRIKQTFATGRYSKENFLCWFSNLMATVEGQLCWSISYNTCFIRQEIISLLIENLTKIIKELIK